MRSASGTMYDMLAGISPNPMVTLNLAVAGAMVDGPRAGLDLLATRDADERMAGHHLVEAVRAHLLEMAGDPAAARAGYQNAARLTTSVAEQRHLEARAARLVEAGQTRSKAIATDPPPPRQRVARP